MDIFLKNNTACRDKNELDTLLAISAERAHKCLLVSKKAIYILSKTHFSMKLHLHFKHNIFTL